uniref:Smad nuclear interacting protein 1 n=1 Tax=Phallusia mammillata TaxID=59560 RepID=A0A6F9DSL0_9ASCI|nr:smad nuclear interacting protein 1 [Phallusia mammillata]
MPKSDKHRNRKRSSSESSDRSPSPVKKKKKRSRSKDEIRKKHNKHDKQRNRSPESGRDSSPEIPRHKKHRPKSPELKSKWERSPDNEKVRVKKEPSYRHHSPERSRYTHDRRIKREEDFDRRQEELRSRRNRHEHPGDHRRSNQERNRRDFHVKEEPQDERRRGRDQHQRDRRMNDERRLEERQRRDESGQTEEAFENKDEEPVEKEKPNLGLSGALTEDKNSFRGVVIKYREPPEARVPKKKWRLYPFKGTESLKVLHLHRQSAYLIGRLRRIADIPVDHPSCSKQHAVFQFRMVEQEVDGVLRRRVKPYIIDLGASNGTFVNNEQIEPQRYVELKEQDVLKFGFSSREYVLLHAKSDTADVGSESEEEVEEES